jgi:hypothetical protein
MGAAEAFDSRSLSWRAATQDRYAGGAQAERSPIFFCEAWARNS